MARDRKKSSVPGKRREHREYSRGTQAAKHKGEEELKEATELQSGHGGEEPEVERQPGNRRMSSE